MRSSHIPYRLDFVFFELFPAFHLKARSIYSGIRWSGQWSTQRPHLMQAVSFGNDASFSTKASVAFVLFKTGESRSGTAMPIIGPPYSTFFGSALKPPQNS